MNDYQTIFIKNLKSIRKEKKITQAQLAELCEISNGTIGNIECGVTKPSFDLMVKFADVLNVSPSDFFFIETPQVEERNNLLNKIKTDLLNFIEQEFKTVS